jgi:hypothetical protein
VRLNLTFFLLAGNMLQLCLLVSGARFRNQVLPAGGLENYLNQKYPDEAMSLTSMTCCCSVMLQQASMLDFAEWIDKFATADGTTRAQIES